MVDSIFNPITIINELFGSAWLFIAVLSLFVLYFSKRFRFNLQLTIILLIYLGLSLGLVLNGIKNFYLFIIITIAMFIAYVFWRWIATK